MVDLDRLGGVSFQKGCYPGQEIVARTQYLGRVKRRLHLAFTTALPAPGAAVQTADAGEPAGTVLQARRLDTDRSVVLAVLDESLAASVPLRLATGDPLADVRLCRPD